MIEESEELTRAKQIEGNLLFHMGTQNILKGLLSRTKGQRVLDFGAGETPRAVTLHSHLHHNQETVAYDPHLLRDNPIRLTTSPTDNGILWVKSPPVDQRFDLVVANFSLHHSGKPPANTLAEMTDYIADYLVICDYDFTNTSLQEFKQIFTSDAELKELQQLFNGDWEKCFAFHSQFGLADYRMALANNGLTLVAKSFGKDIAKNKFLMISRTSPQSIAA